MKNMRASHRNRCALVLPIGGGIIILNDNCYNPYLLAGGGPGDSDNGDPSQSVWPERRQLYAIARDAFGAQDIEAQCYFDIMLSYTPQKVSVLPWLLSKGLTITTYPHINAYKPWPPTHIHGLIYSQAAMTCTPLVPIVTATSLIAGAAGALLGRRARSAWACCGGLVGGAAGYVYTRHAADTWAVKTLQSKGKQTEADDFVRWLGTRRTTSWRARLLQRRPDLPPVPSI